MLRWGYVFHEPAPGEKTPPFRTGDRIPLQCTICGFHTDAPVIAQCITPASEFLQLPAFGMQMYNCLVQCTRCQSGLLALWAFGRVGTDSATLGPALFPYPTAAFATDRMGEDSIPAAILEDLRQAELAEYASSYYGAGLLLRRACQYICRQQGIPDDKGLDRQIAELGKRGTITASLAALGDTVRIIGNELAHPDADTPFVITPSDVRIAREFTIQVVRAVYVDPARAIALRADLDRRGVK